MRLKRNSYRTEQRCTKTNDSLKLATLEDGALADAALDAGNRRYVIFGRAPKEFVNSSLSGS
jgi:hypothetical protein